MMYGDSYFSQGFGGQNNPVGMSAQGLPINMMSGNSDGNSNFMSPQQGQVTGQAAGQDSYGAISNSPDWLQGYYQNQMVGEGDPNFYNQASQMRDIQNQSIPNLQGAYREYGQDTVNNPWFTQNNFDYADPFSGPITLNGGSFQGVQDYFNSQTTSGGSGSTYRRKSDFDGLMSNPQLGTDPRLEEFRNTYGDGSRDIMRSLLEQAYQPSPDGGWGTPDYYDWDNANVNFDPWTGGVV